MKVSPWDDTTTDHPDFVTCRRFARMAPQLRLGLLSEQWVVGVRYYHRSITDGTDLIADYK
jgi:hypothetical protein